MHGDKVEYGKFRAEGEMRLFRIVQDMVSALQKDGGQYTTSTGVSVQVAVVTPELVSLGSGTLRIIMVYEEGDG